MRCLGLDPGLGRCGWAVVDADHAIAYGTWTTQSRVDSSVRLAQLGQQVQDALRTFHPHAAIIESLFFGANHTTAMMVSEARGVLLAACGAAGIPCYGLTPQQIKQAVTGDGRASKAQVRTMVTRLWHLSQPPTPDDTADALAIAWAGWPQVQLAQRVVSSTR